MPMGKCALCLSTTDLQRSHAIPNSIFKKILKQNNGQAIMFNDDETSPVDYSSNSWWAYQLCSNCEQHLNTSYEQYSLSAIRGGKAEVIKQNLYIIIKNIDTLKLQLFFLSILWRAANSQNEAYQKINISESLNNDLRRHLLNKTRVPLHLISVKISRLTDRTKNGGFSQAMLRDIICSPFNRSLPNQRHSFCFLFEGFFIEIFFPGHTSKNRNEKGVINPLNNIILVPYLDIFDIPEVVKLLVSGYKKDLEGNVNISPSSNGGS